MTKQKFLSYCLSTYGTSPDYPFEEDFVTAVLRHADNPQVVCHCDARITSQVWL